jgi:alpha-glucosidase
MKRSKELLMRWAETSALSPLMRSHEGNRPRDNWQFDGDEETLRHLGAMGRFHVALAPYLAAMEAENSARSLPLMRPLFLHHGEDPATWSIKDEYLLGEDLLVAPVLVSGSRARSVHLPPGRWLHLWSGREYEGGAWEVPADLGEPPVFVRGGSRWLACFEAARAAALSDPA